MLPETTKTGFKKSSFRSNLITGPKVGLDGVTQWTPKPLYSEDNKEGNSYKFN